MRGWWTPLILVLIAACSSDQTDPGIPPDVPASLASTTLDGAVALTWTDNSYTSDPANFESYRIYSTSFDIDVPSCGTSWGLEGTTVAPEFLVGALVNGIPRCFAVSATSRDGAESARSATVSDTPRPDSRNVLLFARQAQDAGSGFRFWDDINSDQQVQDNELGLVRPGSASSIDFSVERDPDGFLFLTPVRAGTGVELYGPVPVEDLTSIDLAVCTPDSSVDGCAPYLDTPIEASPGFGYVFEADGGDGFARFGAVRVTHVGQTFLIMDWAFQTDPGNPELLVAKKNSSP
ncbi:MAG: hypothetical protein QOH59_2154 [Gemmatimonadales bacterium]|jgi:hypothetical protein|nr:hypothetical protein [Gemmatimonadales bacterium]